MQRLLISAKLESEAKFIKSYLESKLLFRVGIAEGIHAVEAAAREQSAQLLLLQTGQVAAQDLVYAQNLRRLGYTHPILMLTDKLGSTDVAEAGDRHRVHFLEKPFEPSTLLGLVRKLMLTRNVGAQAARRYTTDLNATVETFVSSERYDSRMLNVSRGGAYFEASRALPLATGDLLRLRVYLVEMDRDHYIHGRVVWTSPKRAPGEFKMGVKFLKSSDIYRDLVGGPG